MKTWHDYPELKSRKRFLALLEEEGSFDAMAKRLSCDRMSVRHAAAAHGVESPYVVQPKYLRGK